MSFFSVHDAYREQSLLHRRFKHQQVLDLIAASGFKSVFLGHSFQGREIKKVVLGSGKRKILLWSQMHGNEATATMAIFDIFNYFKESQSSEAKTILQNLELHFVPMINPDGADLFQRRTSQEIDMNRDAVALQCPESQILKGLVSDLQPEFSFNLHDQAIYYAVGDSDKQATIAFLATAYNEAREWNQVRTKAMQVICSMDQTLQEIIPGRVGRFSDEFEPRAFGDNIQKWGSSLILIESGGYLEDTEKQYIRALNFHSILHALLVIAKEDYTHHTLKEYEAIPANNRSFVDLKITNLAFGTEENSYVCDLGILREEKNTEGASDFVYESVIEEMGDLSVFHGIRTFDAKGGRIMPIDSFPQLKEFHSISEAPNQIKTGETATFVIDYGETQTLVINGEII